MNKLKYLNQFDSFLSPMYMGRGKKESFVIQDFQKKTRASACLYVCTTGYTCFLLQYRVRGNQFCSLTGQNSSKLHKIKFRFRKQNQHVCTTVTCIKHHYLLPKCSIMSVVSVDLLLLSNACEAAFLSKADPAMHPITVGLMLASPLAAHWRAHDTNTATLQGKRASSLRIQTASSNSLVENLQLTSIHLEKESFGVSLLMLSMHNMKLDSW